MTKPAIARCDHCRRKLSASHECYRPAPRTNRKFCSRACYGEYASEQRAGDRCRRCGVPRRCFLMPIFSRSCCQRCYATLRLYAFNFGRADEHEQAQAMKIALPLGITREGLSQAARLATADGRRNRWNAALADILVSRFGTDDPFKARKIHERELKRAALAAQIETLGKALEAACPTS